MRIAIEGCELTSIKLLTYRFFCIMMNSFMCNISLGGGGGEGRDINSGGEWVIPVCLPTSVYIPDGCLSFPLLFFLTVYKL